MAWCLDAFAITVVGTDVLCKMVKESGYDDPSFTANSLETAMTVELPFMYAVGEPQRTIFASGYVSSRNGSDGNPPALGARSFDPAVPVLTGAADALKGGTFTVLTPSYTQSAAQELGNGVDNYALQVFIKEAGDLLPGSNISPPN